MKNFSKLSKNRLIHRMIKSQNWLKTFFFVELNQIKDSISVKISTKETDLYYVHLIHYKQ